MSSVEAKNTWSEALETIKQLSNLNDSDLDNLKRCTYDAMDKMERLEDVIQNIHEAIDTLEDVREQKKAEIVGFTNIKRVA